MSRKGEFLGAGRSNRPRPWPGERRDPALALGSAGRFGSDLSELPITDHLAERIELLESID